MLYRHVLYIDMSILGIPRSKISYLLRLKQDLAIATQLDLTDEAEKILDRIKVYKDKQSTARKGRNGQTEET
jgi:hypothetical protein